MKKVVFEGKTYISVHSTKNECAGCAGDGNAFCEQRPFQCDHDEIWVISESQPGSFEELIKRNYETVKRRGQLSDDLMVLIKKIESELRELWPICDKPSEFEHGFDPSEAVDVILTSCTLLQKFGYDILTEIQKKVEYNEKRVD